MSKQTVRYCDKCNTRPAVVDGTLCAKCKSEDDRIDARMKRDETKPVTWRDVWGVRKP